MKKKNIAAHVYKISQRGTIFLIAPRVMPLRPEIGKIQQKTGSKNSESRWLYIERNDNTTLNP